MNTNILQLEPATKLDDVYKTMSPEPLMTKEQIEAFYRDQLNQIRGDDKVKRISLGLRRSFGGIPYKVFLMGHAGVGKSTELTKLCLNIEDQYQSLRFSVTKELNPVCFQPFDVLLLLIIEIIEKTEKITEKKPDNALLQKVYDWFSKETIVKTQNSQISGTGKAGAGSEGGSIWAKVLGLFAEVRGEIKYASGREIKEIEYQLQRLSPLIELTNNVLDECNNLLWNSLNKEWIVIGEDFDKPGIPEKQVTDFFITYANVLKELRTNIIFTIPINLACSDRAASLPFQCYTIPDTPVYTSDHKAHNTGRKAIKEVLKARIKPSLFEKDQMERFIIASSGNLRDLFTLVSESADNALLKGSKKISEEDATKAINTLRNDFERRLGESPFDYETVEYPAKEKLLLDIYNQKPDVNFPQSTLNSLLRSKAVQEFNGSKRWCGVHPLVVDILASIDKIKPKKGKLLGGTDETKA
jgi:GTPase SAR1 family protein